MNCSYYYRGNPTIEAHVRETGERPPGQWCEKPVDPATHGGYVVRHPTERAYWPRRLLWIENARAEASERGGVVVGYRWARRHRLREIRANLSISAEAVPAMGVAATAEGMQGNDPQRETA